jgi:hypothetical protein
VPDPKYQYKHKPGAFNTANGLGAGVRGPAPEPDGADKQPQASGGFLLAWDPVTQKEHWRRTGPGRRRIRPLRRHVGAGGNLVFHGNAAPQPAKSRGKRTWGIARLPSMPSSGVIKSLLGLTALVGCLIWTSSYRIRFPASRRDLLLASDRLIVHRRTSEHCVSPVLKDLQGRVGLVVGVRREWNPWNFDVRFHSGAFESLTTPRVSELGRAPVACLPRAARLFGHRHSLSFRGGCLTRRPPKSGSRRYRPAHRANRRGSGSADRFGQQVRAKLASRFLATAAIRCRNSAN